MRLLVQWTSGIYAEWETYDCAPTESSLERIREFWGLAICPIPRLQFLHAKAYILNTQYGVIFVHVVDL